MDTPIKKVFIIIVLPLVQWFLQKKKKCRKIQTVFPIIILKQEPQPIKKYYTVYVTIITFITNYNAVLSF